MIPVNAEEMDWSEVTRGDTHFRRKHLGEEADGEDIGCSLYEIPPGGRSWPYHFHTANEEAIYVLAGTGTLRTPDGETGLEPGDYVPYQSDESGAHRIRNDGDEPLRYLAVSTMTEPDVTVYPDMEKIGVYAGSPPGGREERTVHGYYRIGDDVDYWDEEDAE